MFPVFILIILLGPCSCGDGPTPPSWVLVTDDSIAANPDDPGTLHGTFILRQYGWKFNGSEFEYGEFSFLITVESGNLTEQMAQEICFEAGHGPAKSWSSSEEAEGQFKLNDYSSIDYALTYEGDIIWCREQVDYCDRSRELQDIPGIVVECRPRHTDWGEVGVLASEGGGARSDLAGSLVVGWGNQTGLVCSHPNDTLTADLMCREAGYPGVHTVTTYYAAIDQGKGRLDCWENGEMVPILEAVSCPEDTIDLSECSAAELSSSSSCDIDSTLVVECEQRWVVTSVGLYRNPGGGHDESGVVSGGSMGTVMVELADRMTGVNVTAAAVRAVGTKYWEHSYTSVLCQAVGYNLVSEMRMNSDPS